MWHPALNGCTTKWIAGTLSSNDPASVDLAGQFTNGIVIGFQVFNTHASGDLYWAGQGVTATTDAGLIEFGEDSGFVPGSDTGLSLLRETGVSVTYKVMVIGR